MEISDKTKIKINFNGFFEKIKKSFRNDYFKLTFLYLVVYAIISSIMVYGIAYLSTGELDYGNIRSEIGVVTITLMMTMATMAKRLKDDIVSNYWKLVKSRRRQPRKKS